MGQGIFETTFRIDAAHPALAGHFPGQPIVPGVVLLDRVAAALETWQGAIVTGLPQVKFLRPLEPDQTATLRIDLQGDLARFTLLRDADTLATGQLRVHAGALE